MQLRLLTYNIHKCIGGVDRKYDPKRIIQTIEHYEPDIVLLQEVDDGVPRSHRDRQVDLLGDALGYEHRAYQGNVSLKQGEYGNAILSRWPLKEIHNIELTVWPKKRRRAQVVSLSIDASTDGPHATRHINKMVIANVHLGLAAFERKIQLKRLLNCSPITRADEDTPVIIAGDFNDVWHNLGGAHLAAELFQPALGQVKTFPAAMPLRCLDGIYFRGPLQVLQGFAGHTNLAKQASDHLPAVAELACGKPD